MIHSKPFIKIIDILLLIVRFVKSSDQTIIIHIIKKKKKKKSVLVFLIDPSNCFTRVRVSKIFATCKMKISVVSLVCSLQPSTNVTKNFILGVVGFVDPPLELYNVF